MVGIRRREFITLVGSAALTWPVAAPAQPKVPVVGWLSAQAARGRFSETFVEGLKDSGFVEGRNVIIENRFADGRNDRLPALAAELVHSHRCALGSGDPRRQGRNLDNPNCVPYRL